MNPAPLVPQSTNDRQRTYRGTGSKSAPRDGLRTAHGVTRSEIAVQEPRATTALCASHEFPNASIDAISEIRFQDFFSTETNVVAMLYYLPYLAEMRRGCAGPALERRANQSGRTAVLRFIRRSR